MQRHYDSFQMLPIQLALPIASIVLTFARHVLFVSHVTLHSDTEMHTLEHGLASSCSHSTE
eukprot:1369875-Pleurochrysis_carterae.AAC.2